MTSMFENTQSKVTVHILHDDTLTEDNRYKLIRTAERYTQTLDLIDVTSYKNQMNDDIKRALRHLTIGTLYRLCLPDVLKLGRVIYLDCDIVVNLDILELWMADEEENCLAGVHSQDFERLTEAVRDRLNGGDSASYINAGVLIMNLEQIRKRCNLFEASIQWIARRSHLMYFGDQDILNSLFCGSIKLISGKFNNFNPVSKEQCADSIIHTPGFNKIWGVSGLYSQKLYWHYYLRSAWGEDKFNEELVDIMIEASFNHTPVRSPLWKRILKPFVKIFMKIRRSAPIVITEYVLKDIFYRTKYRLCN